MINLQVTGKKGVDGAVVSITENCTAVEWFADWTTGKGFLYFNTDDKKAFCVAGTASDPVEDAKVRPHDQLMFHDRL